MIEGRDCSKCVTITDKYRSNEKLVSANSLDQFMDLGSSPPQVWTIIITVLIGREFLGLSEKEPVYAVLEDDGTEVDEEVNIYFMYIYSIFIYL